MCKKLLLFVLIFTIISVFSQKKFEIFSDFDQDILNQKALIKLNSWLAEKNKIEVTKIYGYYD